MATFPEMRCVFKHSRQCLKVLKRQNSSANCATNLYRAFSSRTRAQQESFSAAPEIDLNTVDSDVPLLKRLRVVPASPAYFTSKPSFTDDLLALHALDRKYKTLPRVPNLIAPRVAWKNLISYRDLVGGEPVTSARYARLVIILRNLNRIHPALMPPEVSAALVRYKKDVQPADEARVPQIIDEAGRAFGVGRRKTSSARAWVVEGDGEVLINGRSLSQFFERIHDRESAIWALKATSRLDKYNVFAIVQGGGVTGQAEALTLAVAKALMVHEPLLKPALRRAGCVTRDPRKVERKKPGHVKARKMPTWVKR